MNDFLSTCFSCKFVGCKNIWKQRGPRQKRTQDDSDSDDDIAGFLLREMSKATPELGLHSKPADVYRGRPNDDGIVHRATAQRKKKSGAISKKRKGEYLGQIRNKFISEDHGHYLSILLQRTCINFVCGDVGVFVACLGRKDTGSFCLLFLSVVAVKTGKHLPVTFMCFAGLSSKRV